MKYRLWQGLIAAVTVFASISLPGIAQADGGRLLVDVPGDGESWVGGSSTPLFDVTDLAPGSARSAVLGLRNGSAHTASIAIDALNVHDDDNGCNDPEQRADATCADGAGELAEQLVFRVYREDAAGVFPSTPAWTGNIDDLTATAVLDREVDAGDETRLKLVARLPRSSGNETQTDLLSFDLRVTATAELPSEGGAVSGPEALGTGGVSLTGGSINAGGGATAAGLAFTGMPAASLAMLGVALLLAGYAVRAFAVRHRRRGS